MKLFRKARSLFQFVGIRPPETIQGPYNLRILMTLFCLAPCTFCSSTFLFSKAETFTEYAESFYFSSTLYMNTTVFLINVWKMKQLFKFISNLEHGIQKSELIFVFFNVH